MSSTTVMYAKPKFARNVFRSTVLHSRANGMIQTTQMATKNAGVNVSNALDAKELRIAVLQLMKVTYNQMS